MATVRAQDIYEQYVEALPATEQLQLLALIAQRLAADAEPSARRSRRSLMEFYGVGKGSRDGSDAQEYVNRLRSEWDHRP